MSEQVYTYEQKTGRLLRPDGIVAGTGYSGFSYGKNNPAAQKEAGIGPIPCGIYRVGSPHEHRFLGHYVCDLIPEDETPTFGRTAFRLHGDSYEHPGLASHGCIVQGHAVREEVVKSGLRIKVVSGIPPEPMEVA